MKAFSGSDGIPVVIATIVVVLAEGVVFAIDSVTFGLGVVDIVRKGISRSDGIEIAYAEVNGIVVGRVKAGGWLGWEFEVGGNIGVLWG